MCTHWVMSLLLNRHTCGIYKSFCIEHAVHVRCQSNAIHNTMSILYDEEKLALIEKAKEYDYIRFSWPDLNGISRGKTVMGRYAEKFIRNGVSTYPGTICMGPRTELTNIQRLQDSNHGNVNFVPASSVYDLAWAGDNKYKVGQIICEAFWPDCTPIIAHPRTAAKRQLARLDSMGYKLYSAFEAEFIVVDATSLEPVFKTTDCFVDSILSRNSAWIYDSENHLRNLGINIEALHAEYSPGQFELCMAPESGIDTFDGMFMMKGAMREILPQHGFKPSFMTRPFANEGCSSGFHFNHSLWDAQGQSVFFDASKPLNMSDTYRHWIGGLIKHTNSLVALCCPTPNCHRRLHQPWAPHKADWGIDNRLVAFRVKNADHNGSYVESRLPSSACNAYLVAAATIAAGLDGIENRIEPPEMGDHELNPTILSFEDCMKALQEDKVFVNALGDEFVEWFVAMKKEADLKKLKNITVAITKEEELVKEREEYFDLI